MGEVGCSCLRGENRGGGGVKEYIFSTCALFLWFVRCKFVCYLLGRLWAFCNVGGRRNVAVWVGLGLVVGEFV